MKKTLLPGLVLLLALLLLPGCAAYMQGYTNSRSMDRYLLVDAKTGSFGYERLQYSVGFFPPLKGFVKSHGTPDVIYPFKDENKREGLRLYYVSSDKVYIFVKDSWRPDSLYLQDEHALTASEKAICENLKTGGN